MTEWGRDGGGYTPPVKALAAVSWRGIYRGNKQDHGKSCATRAKKAISSESNGVTRVAVTIQKYSSGR